MVLWMIARCAFAQNCGPIHSMQAERYSTYKIHSELIDSLHTIRSLQEVVFRNHSQIPLDNILIYLYLNAFRDEHSSFLRGRENIFGRAFKNRRSDEWSHLNFSSFQLEYNHRTFDILKELHYIYNDDGNDQDRTVLELCLPELLEPGDSITLKMEWDARMPKVIARAGYSQDFYLFCHWFPQLGVLEQNSANQWQWNCHQFFSNTEFYGEFSDFDVWMKYDTSFRHCASGEMIDQIRVGGQFVSHFRAEKMIDFAWALHRHAYIRQWKWNSVHLRLMLPIDYAGQEQRVVFAINKALDYMAGHVGFYPYSTLSIICPPLHAVSSGLMEYPTLITTGSFYGMPECIHSMESLVVHELAHQYFMGAMANNEKEEPWMDEGFATYYEDRIIDAMYGDHHAMVNCMGIQMDNKDITRMEYTGLSDPGHGVTARPAWCFADRDRKGMIYSKTATIFHSLERMIGSPVMDTVMKRYFHCYQFTHPRGMDFFQFLQGNLYTLLDSASAAICSEYVRYGIFEEGSMDYMVADVKAVTPHDSTYAYEISLRRNGTWTCRVPVQIEFSDHRKSLQYWDGGDTVHLIRIESGIALCKVHIDPGHYLLTDLNLNNNSYSVEGPQFVSSYLSGKLAFWWQNAMHYISLMM